MLFFLGGVRLTVGCINRVLLYTSVVSVEEMTTVGNFSSNLPSNCHQLSKILPKIIKFIKAIEAVVCWGAWTI